MYVISMERIHDIFDFFTWIKLKTEIQSNTHCLRRVYLSNGNRYLKEKKGKLEKSCRAFTSPFVMDNIWIYSTCTQFYDLTSTAYGALTMLYKMYTENVLSFASCLIFLIAMDIYALAFDIICTNLCTRLIIRPGHL